MTQEQTNKARTRQFYEDIWHGGKLDLIDEYIAPGLPHRPERPEAGTYKDFLTNYRNTIPDIQYTLANMIAEGDRVAWSWVGRWTDPQSGKPMRQEGLTMHRLADGKIVERLMRSNPAVEVAE